jgi:hypothetical protein
MTAGSRETTQADESQAEAEKGKQRRNPVSGPGRSCWTCRFIGYLHTHSSAWSRATWRMTMEMAAAHSFVNSSLACTAGMSMWRVEGGGMTDVWPVGNRALVAKAKAERRRLATP